MQVFAPFDDVDLCAMSLDPQRLGNQVYRECLTLIRGKWPNHPASKIWTPHKHALAIYSLACLRELKSRGRDYPHWFRMFEYYKEIFPDTGFPPIWGRKDYHLSHQSNLINKKPEWYRPLFGVDVPLDLEYVWE